MDCDVGGFHLVVRTHVSSGGYGSRRGGGIASLLKLNATGDIEFSSRARAGIVDDVEASLALEARVELVKQFADFGGEVVAVRVSVDDGDWLFRKLDCLYGVFHEKIVEQLRNG